MTTGQVLTALKLDESDNDEYDSDAIDSQGGDSSDVILAFMRGQMPHAQGEP